MASGRARARRAHLERAARAGRKRRPVDVARFARRPGGEGRFVVAAEGAGAELCDGRGRRLADLAPARAYALDASGELSLTVDERAARLRALDSGEGRAFDLPPLYEALPPDALDRMAELRPAGEAALVASGHPAAAARRPPSALNAAVDEGLVDAPHLTPDEALALAAARRDVPDAPRGFSVTPLVGDRA
jgi:hypothetical protein